MWSGVSLSLSLPLPEGGFFDQPAAVQAAVKLCDQSALGRALPPSVVLLVLS